MNKSSVRRALTTLKKNNLLEVELIGTDLNPKALLRVIVDAELIQPKKKVYIKKTKKSNKKDYIEDGGMSN